MKIVSLFKKAINLAQVNFLNPDRFISRTLYLNLMYKQDLKYIKTILFYFDDKEYMHLGDHLFFIPLIKSFQDSGYKVEVVPTKIMQPLFERLGFTIGNRRFNYESYDLIISRIEMITQLSKFKSILVHVSKKLSMPICDQMLYDFNRFFNLQLDPVVDYSLLYDEKISAKFNLTKSKRLVFFNLYCDAASYLVTKVKKKLIIDKLQEFANNDDYELVFVGSQADKLKDDDVYPFRFIDLRGETSVIEMFNLANLDNVYCYVGFDAFVMHVFSLLHKPSYVVFRGRISKRQHDLLKKFHVNLFNKHNYVTLLNE